MGGIKEVEGMTDVLITTYDNPECKGTYFKIYHFIFNIYRPERKKSA